MKYIVVKGLTKEIAFIFPKHFNHKVFYESLQSVADNHLFVLGEVVSAGYYSPINARCYGQSTSLGVMSRNDVDMGVICG